MHWNVQWQPLCSTQKAWPTSSLAHLIQSVAVSAWPKKLSLMHAAEAGVSRSASFNRKVGDPHWKERSFDLSKNSGTVVCERQKSPVGKFLFWFTAGEQTEASKQYLPITHTRTLDNGWMKFTLALSCHKSVSRMAQLKAFGLRVLVLLSQGRLHFIAWLMKSLRTAYNRQRHAAQLLGNAERKPQSSSFARPKGAPEKRTEVHVRSRQGGHPGRCLCLYTEQ